MENESFDSLIRSLKLFHLSVIFLARHLDEKIISFYWKTVEFEMKGRRGHQSRLEPSVKTLIVFIK